MTVIVMAQIIDILSALSNEIIDLILEVLLATSKCYQRHEAISRFFEIGLSTPKFAFISGHKDPRILFRYTHMKAENVLAKVT